MKRKTIVGLKLYWKKLGRDSNTGR